MELKGNKEQTAVEGLINHLIGYGFDLSLHEKEIEHFKEMGKQQIIMAHDDQYNYDMWPSSIPTLGQQYYNEKYG